MVGDSLFAFIAWERKYMQKDKMTRPKQNKSLTTTWDGSARTRLYMGMDKSQARTRGRERRIVERTLRTSESEHVVPRRRSRPTFIHTRYTSQFVDVFWEKCFSIFFSNNHEQKIADPHRRIITYSVRNMQYMGLTLLCILEDCGSYIPSLLRKWF